MYDICARFCRSNDSVFGKTFPGSKPELGAI